MRTAAGALIALALLAGCSRTESRTGRPEVYERISSTYDCGELQDDFDVASRNFDHFADNSVRRQRSLDYMDAALDRMKELGCP